MGFSPEKQVARHRASDLVVRFQYYVDRFDREPPFTGEQLRTHIDTIRRRRSFSLVKDAVDDQGFVESLYRTLTLWGIGKRASTLLPFETFWSALRRNSSKLSELEGLRLEECPSVERVAPKLWGLIAGLGIVANNNNVVAGTKCIHHVLPDLMPPMDRAYTQTFFGWGNPEFQYHPRECFEYAFRTFARIANQVAPSRLVGEGWRSSGPKILDNAVVGYCIAKNLRSSRVRSGCITRLSGGTAT